MAVLVVASTCAIVIASSPAGAGAGKTLSVEPTPFGYIDPAVKAKMLAQAPLSAAAARILRVIERGDMTGYAGIGLDDSGVVLWWKGRLPGPVGKAIEAERRTVAVTVRHAPHSRAELRRAAAGIDADLRANRNSPYFGIEIAHNGSGITVDVDANAAANPVQSVPARWAVPAGVPVSFKRGPRASFTGLGSRLSDRAPYYGGGRIQSNDNGGYCTAGFAVTNGAANYLLTAAHCGRPGGSWNNGDDSRFVGTATLENVDHDVLLIPASVAGRIFDGVQANEFTRNVVGSNDAIPGEMVCTSGSTTGGACGLRVSNDFQFSFCGPDIYGTYECVYDLVLADRLDGARSSAPGDSGGPVFSLSGSSGVIAKGTITGRTGAGFSKLMFQDFVTAQRDFGISVMTI
jgi:hypothetical protein